MFPKKIQYCPVCPKSEGQLGYYTPGMARSFVCKDCQFVYSWDREGKMLPPVKYVPPKRGKKCGCPSCRVRDGLIDVD